MVLDEREKERHARCVQKKDLEDGAYYRGSCRNADLARWNAGLEKFFYNRHKFGSVFVEPINCPEDDSGFDLFFPEEKVVPTQDQLIPKSSYHEDY